MEQKINIGGMTCVSCQNKIEKKLRNTTGVQKADVNYSTGTALVRYDASVVTSREIAAVIRKLGYEILSGDKRQEFNVGKLAGIAVIIAALYILLQQTGVLNLLAPSQLAEAGMSYGMLFMIGLLTSVHCLAMCGGINLSQCIPQTNALRSASLYNLGRVISYTAVGFLVGALGSVITFSPIVQGILKLAAGVFMIIMGINILGVFPWLRRLNPRMPKYFAPKVGGKGPLVVGLLNGLMPCGPLQAMQIYALSTGNAFAGAAAMLLFSLGTVPLMFGLGALSSIMSKKFKAGMMTAGAVLVVVLGLSMMSQGWSLSGVPTSVTESEKTASADTDVQVVNSTLSRSQYPAITVQAGRPVKWVIDAPEGSISGCNQALQIPEYGIQYSFQTGENIIEFTPTKTGTFQYSCWMGMIRSTITVD